LVDFKTNRPKVFLIVAVLILCETLVFQNLNKQILISVSNNIAVDLLVRIIPSLSYHNSSIGKPFTRQLTYNDSTRYTEGLDVRWMMDDVRWWSWGLRTV
jgi:hypothetical protein